MGEIARTYEKYPEVGDVLPAMGYGTTQIRDLKKTIDAVDCDLVLVGTPIDLARIIDIEKPNLRVTYELLEEGDALAQAIERTVMASGAETGRR